MNLYVGTSGYSYKEWKGKFYPQDLAPALMLHYYSQHFRSVEINNTFYRMPKPSVLEAWASAVSADFRFAVKAPQQITHIKQLKEAGDAVSYFFKTAGVLKKRLGPVLFQLPPYLRKDAPRLLKFIKALGSKRRIAFEFRHPSWFDEEVFGLLRDHGMQLCIADAESKLEVPFVSTAGWGYLRLRRPGYDDAELKAWLKRVRETKWREAFIFFKHEDDAKGPLLAKRFLEFDQKG